MKESIESKRDIRQIRMSSGAELICEVLEEQQNNMVVSNVLQLNMKVGEDSYRYFVFNPYMINQEDPTSALMLMIHHVEAFAIPSDFMKEEYISALQEIRDSVHEEDEYQEEEEVIEDEVKGNVVH